MSKENKPEKIKFIIKEIFSGKQTSMELFADILLAGLKNNWTKDKQGDIIKWPTVKS